MGRQQRVEILKALYRKADILILDEPTGVLTPAEADQLFRILNRLREEGKTIILITHKLREIMEITDTVSVMRRGQMTATVKTSETSPEQLAELMVGRKVLLRVDKKPAAPKDDCAGRPRPARHRQQGGRAAQGHLAQCARRRNPRDCGRLQATGRASFYKCSAECRTARGMCASMGRDRPHGALLRRAVTPRARDCPCA